MSKTALQKEISQILTSSYDKWRKGEKPLPKEKNIQEIIDGLEEYKQFIAAQGETA